MEHHDGHNMEGDAKQMERGLWFIQLISTTGNGMQILPVLEMQSYNTMQDIIGIFPPVAFSSWTPIWISNSIFVTSILASQFSGLKKKQALELPVWSDIIWQLS